MNETITQHLEFNNNIHFLELLGPEDIYLSLIENHFGVTLKARGNVIAITGLESNVGSAKNTLLYLYNQLSKGQSIDEDVVQNAIYITTNAINIIPIDNDSNEKTSVSIKRKVIFPRSPNQAEYLKAMQTKDLIFASGVAGTGKTYLAVSVGVSLLISGKIDRIILTRPAVEAGEKLGFLPGDMREKVNPYLRPLYDAMHHMLPTEQVEKRLNNGDIEVAPLAFMRGRTLSNAFVILDEAQNTTPTQMKMFLTRLGYNSRMVVTGDLTQIDLPPGIESGLKHAMHILQNIPDVAFIDFTEADVVRHPLVSKIVTAYAQNNA